MLGFVGAFLLSVCVFLNVRIRVVVLSASDFWVFVFGVLVFVVRL